MPLAAGSRLGPYEIVAPLGAGGMGEVYKARDARLERTVAIKLLPPSLAGDPEFRARFEREAKNISALNHPHICTLHDVGEIDLESLQLSGGPVSLVEDIRQTGASGAGAGQLALSETGTLVFVSGTRRETSNLVWVDRDGREEPIEAPPDAYAYPRVSPDGTKVVVNTIGSDSDIWIWDLVRKTRTKLTSGPETDSYAVWTPDSRWVVFSSFLASGQGDLHRRAADGTGALERLTETREGEAPQMVLADGVRVLVRRMSGATGSLGALTLVPLVPGLKPEAVFATSVPPQVSGEISPDGRWIAYQSAEGSTRDEIQVRPFPRTESGHWQISSGGGTRPMWSKSGRELFYVPARPDPLMSVQVHPTRPGESFSYSTPLRLFGIEKYRLGIVGRGFDISPDGRRFLMVVPVGTDVRSVSH